MRRSAGPTAQRPWQDGRLHLPLLSDESIVKPALVQLGQHPRQRLSQHSRFWYFFLFFFINIIIILCFPGSAAAVTHRPLSYRLIALHRAVENRINFNPGWARRKRTPALRRFSARKRDAGDGADAGEQQTDISAMQGEAACVWTRRARQIPPDPAGEEMKKEMSNAASDAGAGASAAPAGLGKAPGARPQLAVAKRLARWFVKGKPPDDLDLLPTTSAFSASSPPLVASVPPASSSPAQRLPPRENNDPATWWIGRRVDSSLFSRRSHLRHPRSASPSPPLRPLLRLLAIALLCSAPVRGHEPGRLHAVA